MSPPSGGNTSIMSSFGNNAFKDQKPSFWKKNSKSVPGSIRPVYGAQHPPKYDMPSSAPTTPKRTVLPRFRDSFQDFQDDTKDAWDDGDDELISMANFKMSLRDVKSTAMQVLNNHSMQQKAKMGEEKQRDSAEKNGQVAADQEAAAVRLQGVLNSRQGHRKHRSGKPGVAVRVRDIDALNLHFQGCFPSPSVRHPGIPGLAVQLRDDLEPHSQDSRPTTPSHKQGGPGVGVRMPPRQHAKMAALLNLGQSPQNERERLQQEKFKAMLAQSSIDLDELRDLSWKGIPWEYRPQTWKLLAGYVPPTEDRRELTLQRKRQEYFNFVEQYYDTRLSIHKDTFRQISIDIPRMSPLIPIFQQKLVQEIFERILFIWAIRHPASGYVQGMNDLVTPFFVVFLSEFIDTEIEHCEVSSLPSERVNIIEADSFWCFSKMLDSIQDNYLFAQPGIQTKVQVLKDIVTRVNNKLHCHLQEQNVEYLQFAFRWMNNLLTREVPLRCTIRLWDTYLSEPGNFSSLHLYVCAAMLLKYADDLLREKDFQGLMLMLQNLPTHNWNNDEINMLLAEAYRLKYSFADAPRHLQQKS